MSARRTPIAIFASGAGTNFQAMLDASTDPAWPGEIVCLVTDRPHCQAVRRAQAHGIRVVAARPQDFATKQHYEITILSALQAYHVEFIALCGYMRLIGPTLLSAYAGRIVNIHPSLLPAFPGRHAIADALAAGVAETGVTVHFVDEGMDTGPIIAQQAVSIQPGSTEADVLEQIHAVEHALYPAVLKQLLERA